MAVSHDAFEEPPEEPFSTNARELRSDGEMPALPSDDSLNENLSDINTYWAVVDKAKTSGPESRRAQEWVLYRYERAIRRYLSATLPNEDAVSEVYQEYAKVLVEGGFANVEPSRGKFRRYLKRTLSNLVNDYWRKVKRLKHLPIDSGFAEPEARPEPEPFDDQEFTEAWRRDLQERAWLRLKQYEGQTGKPLFTLLRQKVLHRDCRSYQMAEQFADLLGSTASASKVRKLLHQARGRYSEMLLEGVAETIENPSVETLEEELIEVDLYKYCRDAFEEWKRKHQSGGGGGR